MGCEPRFEYQQISEDRYFDIVNLLHYDMILGTPFIQHKVPVGLNPSSVLIGSTIALPIEGRNVQSLQSRAVDLSIRGSP